MARPLKASLRLVQVPTGENEGLRSIMAFIAEFVGTLIFALYGSAVTLQVACATHMPEVAKALGRNRWEALTPAFQALADSTSDLVQAALLGNLHRFSESFCDDFCDQHEHAAGMVGRVVEVCSPPPLPFPR